MADLFDKSKRSAVMAAIKGRDTKPELALRKALHARGLRYRLHVASLPGRPDIVLKRHRAAILVHGCFWHRHQGCKLASTPQDNGAYWQAKFERNMARDVRDAAALTALGWRVAVVWECSLTPRRLGAAADAVVQWLHSDHKTFEWPE